MALIRVRDQKLWKFQGVQILASCTVTLTSIYVLLIIKWELAKYNKREVIGI